MKKRILFIALVLISGSIFAQGSAPLSKGEQQLNFGLGASDHGLPVYIGADFAFHNDWTAGPVLKLILDDDTKFAALGRVDYHWNRLLDIPSNWDFYLGANVGVLSNNGADLNLGLQLGGRYYWSNRWGVNLEVGGGTGFDTSLGLTMKF
ncbi:hypothetical protein [Mangrovibacterium diazotrophicum]|uniref:Outer membrane protein with beta-barrel domain n=1 Tax=Mangrovibacterium diazotrophicum TaxID=1261403 RepID=A0A419W9V9_9BACT|nr:hypothetical protein [Mangrovibacterium diazotrophicum]RKD92260.1 hypothetical protein BC643_2631 [Mangrovibacterium diazotrophicum]